MDDLITITIIINNRWMTYSTLPTMATFAMALIFYRLLKVLHSMIGLIKILIKTKISISIPANDVGVLRHAVPNTKPVISHFAGVSKSL